MSKKSSRFTLAAITVLASLLLSSAAARPYSEGESRGEDARRTLGMLEVEHGEEVLAAREQRANVALAPTGTAPADANIDAIAKKHALATKGVSDPANGHRWTPYGIGPLQYGDPGYTAVNTLGYKTLAGRITDLRYVPRTDKYMPNTVLASVAFAGIWQSTDEGESWRSLGDSLPTQTMGSVGYTPANRGTIIALSGDNSFGRYEREGAGAYYTTDRGKTWHYAPGIPSDTFGYKVATDNSHPNIVYAATGAGLYRSTNGGRSWRNVALPTGPCAGKSPRVKGCLLANQVTDVVVKEPGGSTGERGGQVLAAVGWMMGDTQNPDGTVQSPNNGMYSSETGARGSFTKLSAPGFALQPQIGRIELGAAIGPTQNHNIVYATVQDAILRHQSFEQVRTNDTTVPLFTTWNGLFVTLDFGQTWQRLTSGAEIQHPLTGSQLAVTSQAVGGYGPGIQSWFDEWVMPDPTREVAGIPTRVLFGLEEIWQNELTLLPQAGHSAFHVIGRYYSGQSCLFLSPPVQACPVNREDALTETSTTHADQHAAVFIPQRNGGVKIVVGNDGGVFTQKVDATGEFRNSGWGIGAQKGFRTLEPYDAVISRDGTVWMGMQDNGVAKIQDVKDRRGRVIQRQRIIGNHGGDGFFMAVDPNNSNVAYSEYVYAAMSSTRDGGKTWADMTPPVTRAQFSNPFVLDPLDVDHLITAGNEVVETGSGAGTSAADWVKVFDLGTAHHPGDPDVEEDVQNDAINQMTAIDMIGPNVYVGYCSACDVLDENRPFLNGLATNVGGRQAPLTLTSRGWHIVRPRGLPNRYITSIAIDPDDPKIVYVGLGGYSRRWTPPGTLDRPDPKRVGTGHLYVSTDAGRHFTDISGNLPNTPVNWVTIRGEQLLIATDIGAFVSRPNVSCAQPGADTCQSFEVLGKGLPASPVMTIRVAAHDRNLLTAATYGRGVWLYRFGPAGGSNILRAKRVKPAPFTGKLVAGPFGFEGSPDGWAGTSTAAPESPAAPARPVAEQWRVAPPGNNSATSYQVSPYVDETTAALASPPMRIPGPRHATVRVTWAMRINTEEGYDFLTIDYSSDGRFWQKGSGFTGMNDDYPLFSPYKAEIVVPPGKLFLRFRLTSDQLVSFPANEGVAIDDVLIRR